MRTATLIIYPVAFIRALNVPVEDRVDYRTPEQTEDKKDISSVLGIRKVDEPNPIRIAQNFLDRASFYPVFYGIFRVTVRNV